ncbi:unnamed protein product [Rhizophagus irregularis]|uniref:F-box domain-containing protein n=1 Tax=Rhizophagus irregularis TaxID=588596 RepID=A0A2N1MZK7_9GLOM|nr:hypothetical protein RhiirC2_784064 [Rhizophagus irregularis]CAB4374962.1 unnamed protein product [Rhizophagus irregularis]
MEPLYNELRIEIFKFVDTPISLALTNKKWYVISQDPQSRSDWLIYKSNMSTSPAAVINPVATIIQRFLITKGRFFHSTPNDTRKFRLFDENDSDYNLNYDLEFFYQHYATKYYYVRCKLLTLKIY